MADSSLAGGSRRLRPESGSSSNTTRMATAANAASSANSSGQNLPSPRLQGTASRNAGGTASLLQERLRERKVETARARRGSADYTAAGPRGGIQSSPIRGADSENNRPSSSGVGGKPMGVKQIDHVSICIPDGSKVSQGIGELLTMHLYRRYQPSTNRTLT